MTLAKLIARMEAVLARLESYEQARATGVSASGGDSDARDDDQKEIDRVIKRWREAQPGYEAAIE